MTQTPQSPSNPPHGMSAHEARALMDDYLDGLLSAEQESAFLQVVSEDQTLQNEIDIQNQVNVSIRRIAEPPSPEHFALMCKKAQDEAAAPLKFSISAGGGRRAIIGAVAALLMAAVGIALIWDAYSITQTNNNTYPPQAWRSLATVYTESLDEGFEPTWICADDAEFTDTFEDRYGQGLLMAALPDNMQALGLAYSNTLSPDTIQLLARVDGEPLLVFIDRSGQTAEMPPETLTVQKPLHLHRRTIDNLVLYELSPFESPYLLDSFYNPVEARDP